MESCNVQISLIEARGGLSKLKEASRGRRIHILGYFLCFYLKSFSQEKLLCILRYITSPLFTTMNFWLFITKIMEETEFTQYIFLGIRLIFMRLTQNDLAIKVQRADLTCDVTSFRLRWFEPRPIRDEYSNFAGA